MVRISKELYDNIDAENLLSQWHPDVRKFTYNLTEHKVLEVLKNTKTTYFDTTKYNEVFNFTNTKYCQTLLYRVLKITKVEDFISTLEERDRVHPRDIERGYSVEEIFESVKENQYHPILLLKLDEKLYIIDGRTRLYCCLFLKVPAKVRIVSDNELTSKCSIKS